MDTWWAAKYGMVHVEESERPYVKERYGGGVWRGALREKALGRISTGFEGAADRGARGSSWKLVEARGSSRMLMESGGDTLRQCFAEVLSATAGGAYPK